MKQSICGLSSCSFRPDRSARFSLPQQASGSNRHLSKERPRPPSPSPIFAARAKRRLHGGFNQTLWAATWTAAGIFKMVPKTMYPTTVPQQPARLHDCPARAGARRAEERSPRPPTTGGGRWLADWSGPPVSANYLAFGYTAVQNGVLVLRGWLFDLAQHAASPQVIGKNYLGSVDEAGARKVAHEFAADILALFGGQSLAGTHIYFVSDRTGNKEIWAMDSDGKNQRQITRFNSTSIEPAFLPDGTKDRFY